MENKFVLSPSRFIVVCSIVLISMAMVITVWAVTTKLTSSDISAGDWFGDAVAVDGTTAVIAAYKDDLSPTILDTGAAYIFSHNSTNWIEDTKLTPSDGAAEDYFGFCADIDTDTVVIGSLQQDSGAVNGGAAYVYVKNGSVWSEQQKLLASDAAVNDYLGYSCAISDNTITVGAPYEDNASGSAAGSVYIFTRSGTTWTEQQKLTAPSGAVNDQFGNSIDIDGDTLVVGARYHGGKGAAYIYTKSGTTWSLEQKLVASDAATDDDFGLSTAIDGDRVSISAPGNDDTYSNTGSIYIFERSGTVWSEHVKLTTSDGLPGDYLGIFTIGLSGDYLAAGTPYSDASGSNSGAAYLFGRVDGVWTELDKIVESDVGANDWFGIATDIDGEWIFFGAERSNSVYTDAGSVYAYSISANLPPRKVVQVSPNGTGVPTSPTLVWRPELLATTYSVVVYDETNDTIVFTNSTPYPTTVCTGDNPSTDTCSVQPGISLSTNINYRWLVRAHNNVGDGPWSSFP